MTFLFDGHCRLCVEGGRLMSRLARAGSVELVDFQVPGVLDRFPGLTHAECMRAAQLVTVGGHVASGLEAIVLALATRPLFRWMAWIYFVPGLRQIADAVYGWVARNRYRFLGRVECPGGACALHERAADG
jgi:predicted DCC family thiol-disulfide oxidoreductase YuxK